MPIPISLRAAFSPSTLDTIATRASRFRLRDVLFFRHACTARVTENERSTFTPLVLIGKHSLTSARCTCTPAMADDDLCRHLALLVEHCATFTEGFESSVWRAIAFAAFDERIEITARDADARETLLRKLTRSATEQELLRRGAGSTRLMFEESPWYRWARENYVRGDEVVRLVRRGEAVVLSAGADEIPLPPVAVEKLIELAPSIVTRSGFEIAAQSVTPSLRVTITDENALRMTPVLLDGNSIHERAALPRYGRYFLIDDRFVSPAPAAGLFLSQAAQGQGSLFEHPATGIPLDRETLIAEEDAFAFIEEHRAELAQMSPALVQESVRSARPIRLDRDVIFDFAEPRAQLFVVDVIFRKDDVEVRAADIIEARRRAIPALIRADVWIDVSDSQFSCFDGLKSDEAGRLLLRKLDILRIRGLLRGTAQCRGDRSGDSVFAMFDELHTSSGAPKATDLGLDLYGYQQIGYQWLWHLQQNGFGGLLCDDMGLGKTHQAMALIAALMHVEPSTSVLVVAPTSVRDHWAAKLERYLPGVEVTLTTYGVVRSRIEEFRDRRFDLVVLDEMQTIKNAGTATHQALRSIPRGVVIGLTGTPVENHESELVTLLDFAVPDYLPPSVDREALRRLARPFILRRTKEQVLTELPPKFIDRRTCELTPEQRTIYRQIVESRAKPLRAELRSGKASFIHIFAALNYLKQVCNHPATAGGGFGCDAPSAKWDLFVELLDECMASGLKVVVFSQYLSMLALIEKHLDTRAIGYASIKGSTRLRGAEITRFHNDADCRVFTASVRAASLGIDLTAASVVIHYDRWWNQAREDQATDRVHRLGQNKGVQVIKLITRNTIEEKIDALIASKAALARDLVQADDPTAVKMFSREELEELLEG